MTRLSFARDAWASNRSGIRAAGGWDKSQNCGFFLPLISEFFLVRNFIAEPSRPFDHPLFFSRERMLEEAVRTDGLNARSAG